MEAEKHSRTDRKMGTSTKRIGAFPRLVLSSGSNPTDLSATDSQRIDVSTTCLNT